MDYWSEQAELSAKWLLRWLGVREGKFYDWRQRYGKLNAHNGRMPRDWWLEDWERQAILDGYSRFIVHWEIRAGMEELGMTHHVRLHTALGYVTPAEGPVQK